MKRMHLIAFAVGLTCLGTLSQNADAQGKGKGADKGKGPEKAAQTVEKSDRGREQARPAQETPRPEKVNERRPEKAEKAEGKATGRDISGGVRGVERRSDRANEVAAGPNPKPIKPSYLRADEVKRFKHDLRDNQVNPRVRQVIAGNRASDLVAGGALAYALARGVSPNALLFARNGDVAGIKNRRGNVLVSMKDEDARDLGAWRVAPLRDETGEGAPSFCRSGAGHPVWGRQWCLDKGFGLGASGNTRWGRTQDLNNLRWNGDLGTGSVTRDALIALLGPTAFNRLALHAVTLGLVDPLVGRWATDASGQRVLLVSSGAAPVAELADYNNDSIVDLLLVALRGW